jgi:hypothetical protein
LQRDRVCTDINRNRSTSSSSSKRGGGSGNNKAKTEATGGGCSVLHDFTTEISKHTESKHTDKHVQWKSTDLGGAISISSRYLFEHRHLLNK